MNLYKPFLVFSLLLFSVSVMCQQDIELITIKTLDKSIFQGELDKITTDSVFIFNKERQKMGFAKSNILELTRGISLGPEVVNLSEPYYIPTAYNNGKGNHYYKNYFLFGQNFSYGARDNLDITFGFELISILADNGNTIPIIQIGINYGGEISESVRIGFSTKVMFNDQGGLIMMSVPITIGGSRNNFTISPIVALVTDADNPVYIPAFNWSLGLGKRTRLVTDAIYADEVLLGTSLLEYTFNNGYSALGGVILSNEFDIIPNFGFVIPFGKWKK